MDTKIRVVSWNIQYGIDIETAVDVLLTHPDLRDADVICLQEMDEEGTKEIAEAHPITNKSKIRTPLGNPNPSAWLQSTQTAKSQLVYQGGDRSEPTMSENLLMKTQLLHSAGRKRIEQPRRGVLISLPLGSTGR